jgi:transcription-repair coupling factor (superfamily II helicase)
MLEDAVAELKVGGASEMPDARGWSPNINAGVAVLIPDEYVPT